MLASAYERTRPPHPSPLRGERVPVGRVRGILHVPKFLRSYVAWSKEFRKGILKKTLTPTVWVLPYTATLLMATMLHFQINPHSGVPVYRQVIDQVKYYIASGGLKEEDQLPSIRELAQSLAINPTTVV